MLRTVHLVFSTLLAAMAVHADVDPQALRGAASKLSEFALSSPSSEEYMDCFADSKQDRVMADKMVSSDMTAELCRDHCVGLGALYYGTQYGMECWCGTSDKFTDYNKHGEGKCNMACTGDSSVSCGGYNAVNLFRVINESPVPAPTPQAEPSPASVSSGSFSDLLDLHNAARCMHGADSLSWSDDCATTAEAYAKVLASDGNCGSLFHSTDRDYGENLYYCGSTGSDGCYTAKKAMEGFYEEEVTSGSVTGYGGHATQILWKSTTAIGCGIETCTKGGYNYNVLVCHYDPPGNVMSKLEQEVETPSLSEEKCGY